MTELLTLPEKDEIGSLAIGDLRDVIHTMRDAIRAAIAQAEIDDTTIERLKAENKALRQACVAGVNLRNEVNQLQEALRQQSHGWRGGCWCRGSPAELHSPQCVAARAVFEPGDAQEHRRLTLSTEDALRRAIGEALEFLKSAGETELIGRARYILMIALGIRPNFGIELVPEPELAIEDAGLPCCGFPKALPIGGEQQNHYPGCPSA